MEKENSFKGCLNQIKLSCRRVFIRHLRIFVSDGMVNAREKIRRSRITNFRDDRPLCYNGNNAFTLIELLVVVLIIGILAAVAVPQYQKAVEKSRAAQARTMLASTMQAIENYHLANGEWPQSFDELSIDIPWTGTEKYYDYDSQIKDVRSNGEWSIELGHSDSNGSYVIIGRLNGAYAGGGFVLHDSHWPADYFPGETLCIEGRSNSYGVKFDKADGDYCVKLFGGTFSKTGNLRYYRLAQ